MNNQIRDSIRGAMFGVAVGDALGAPLEFMSAKSIQQQHGTVRDMIGGGWLNVLPGEVTDDTQMTLAVAHGIVDSPRDPIEAIGRYFVKWYNSSPKDVGVTCASSIRSAICAARQKQSPTKADWKRASKVTHNLTAGRTAGNGSLMRTAYVGLYYSDEQEIRQKAYDISRMTHYDEDTAIDCAAYCAALNEVSETENFYERIAAIIGCTEREGRYHFYALSSPFFTPNPTGYVVDSFASALHCIYTTRSFEDAVVKAINLGGDADTIGAITGGLAGALYGYDAIPKQWISTLFTDTRNEINELCDVAIKARTEAGA